MTVALSSLRVSLEMDGSNYVQGAAAIAKANEQMAASGTLAGAQLAQQRSVCLGALPLQIQKTRIEAASKKPRRKKRTKLYAS